MAEEKHKETYFDRLKNTLGSKLKEATQNAIDAYLKLSRQLAGKQANGREVMRDPDRLITLLQPKHLGRMCMYFYDPKWKEELPYFDRFPLVIPIEIYKDGFLGLNLHYLPPNRRAVLMDALYRNVIKNRHLDERKRIIISYQLVKMASRNRNYLPCVKRYLYDHLRSRIYIVDPDDWNIALFLPTERWAKANKRRVYQESLDKIRKG
jgi:hypothetical protein